jgi:hypothetical protein
MELVTTSYTAVSNNPISVSRVLTSDTTATADSSSFTWMLDPNIEDSSVKKILDRRFEMVSLTYPTRIKTEFDVFLKYAQEKTDGATNANFDAFDNYLGLIGV